jgi:regulator of sigma E protease
MLDFIQNAVIYVAPFLIVLGVVVTIHELGHFLAAKSLGVAIDRFSIGFGRALASWTDKSGVEWRIGWIPLGGYVQFSGDANAASVPDQNDLQKLRQEVAGREGEQALSRYFHFKPLWQRAIVVAAGPAANFVLAISLFAAVFMIVGAPTPPPARVVEVSAGTPAAEAGFQVGDLVVEVEGRKVSKFEEMLAIVQRRPNLLTTFVVQRGDSLVTLSATPAAKQEPDDIGVLRTVGQIGVKTMIDGKRVRLGPIEAVRRGAEQTWMVLTTTLKYLSHLVQGKVNADELRGPLGIAEMSGKVAKIGAEGAPSVAAMIGGASANLVMLAAVISVSIGFMNLLPIPVLDGGHLLFYAYEAVVRRPLAASVQAAGYRVGLALVLGLMLFATWNDLQRLRVFKFLGGLLS